MLSRLIEVQSSTEYFRYMAGWATKIERSTLDVSIPIPPSMRYQAYTRRKPTGALPRSRPGIFRSIWLCGRSRRRLQPVARCS